MSKTIEFTNFRAGFDEFGKIVTSSLKRGLSNSNLVASKRTLNSLTYKIHTAGGGIFTMSFISWAKNKWDIFYLIDTGSKPKTPPPITDIEKWMRQKNIQPRKKGRFVKSTKANIRRSAFAISLSISRKGIVKRFRHGGAGIFYKTMKENESLFEEIVLGGYEKDINRAIDNTKK